MKYLLGTILDYAIMIYIFLLVIRVLISWINLPPNALTIWLCKLTDPVLDFFRRTLPIRFGIFDLSIISPITILLVLDKLTSDFLLHDLNFKIIINGWYLLSLVLYIADIVIGFILGLYIIIALIVLIFKLLGQESHYNQNIAYFFNIINPFTAFIERMIKIKSKYKEIISIIILLAVLICFNILKTNVVIYLTTAVNEQVLDINLDRGNNSIPRGGV